VNLRRWTILVVPHDTEAPRQFVVGEQTLRMATALAAVAVVLILGATAVLFSPWATPGARLLARQNAQLKDELTRVDGALAVIGDSLASLAQRESQFRALAGITPSDSVLMMSRPPAPDGAGLRTVSTAGFGGEARRPFAAFFGDRAPRADVSALLARAAELSSALDVVTDTMAVKMDKLRTTPSIMPTRGFLVGEFSHARMHPILRESRPHLGIDLSAPTGTPIVAAAAGVVRKSARDGGYGNVVEIDHGNGIVTRYAHAQRLMVRQGQRVERGQQIATVGSTGLSVGPHLHYEIHVNGTAVDPLTYVIPE
jgi:murein DD-endopeptidase MepM/ murein hydrolase activator NlpD